MDWDNKQISDQHNLSTKLLQRMPSLKKSNVENMENTMHIIL